MDRGFVFTPTEIPEIIEIRPSAFEDERGVFVEMYKQSEFRRGGIDVTFVQDNRSVSRKGVFRGLHFQRPPYAQGKLVQAVSGSILDVALDIRRDSPTLGRHVTVELTDEDQRMLWVPPGFAHGFLALERDTEVHYKMTCEYRPDHEGGIVWSDPEVALRLPIEPVVSLRDSRLPLLSDAQTGF